MVQTTKPRDGQTVFLTEGKFTYDRAAEAATSGNRHMGNANVVFDLHFMESIKGFRFFVDSSNTPTKEGWYHIDRVACELRKIPGQAIDNLGWTERLYVYGDVAQAVAENKPLALLVCSSFDGIGLSGCYSSAAALHVVQVESGHEAATAPQTPGIQPRQ
jgi:hypothetical protein